MPRIVKVTPKDNHTLLIELNNRHKIIYDMKSRLQTSRFCGLEDLTRFKAVQVENKNTLVWDGLCEITIDEILNMLER